MVATVAPLLDRVSFPPTKAARVPQLRNRSTSGKRRMVTLAVVMAESPYWGSSEVGLQFKLFAETWLGYPVHRICVSLETTQ